MAKKEGPVVDNETGKIKVKAKEQQLTNNETKGNVTKVKEKMKKPSQVVEKTITKVDLSKPTPEEAVEKVEEPQVEETAVVETPVLEEVTNEEKVEEIADVVEEALVETIESGIELPENIQKLMDFMDETGGDLNDYVTLNQDYSELDNHTLLKEYYKSTKPHLSEEEVDFVMEDTFAYDEEDHTETEIKRVTGMMLGLFGL